MTDAISTATGGNDLSSYFDEIIQARHKSQSDRIAQGVTNGSLTETEAARLKRQQARIDRLSQKASSDGAVSDGEFARIMHAQDKASHRIYGLKHNDRVADGVTGPETLASNAQLTPTVSNAAGLNGALFADMNKLFQDIANFRQTLQSDRIQMGVDSGQLSAEERQKLKNLQDGATEVLNQAMSDGSMSPEDFADVMRAQTKVSRRIFAYRHNQAMFDPKAAPDGSASGANPQPVSVTV